MQLHICGLKSGQSQWSVVGWHHWPLFHALLLCFLVTTDSTVVAVASGFTAVTHCITMDT